MLEQAHAQRFDMVCFITHPFEFISRDSFRFDNMRANRTNQQRLIDLCDHLSIHSDRFNVTTFKQIDPSQIRLSTSERHPLTGSYQGMLRRTVQNYYTDRFC